MKNIYEIDGMIPVISSKSFIDDSAVIIGDVIIEEGVYIGPFASIRGDLGRIIIRKNSNVQDNCVLHGDPKLDTIVNEEGHIGHGAIVHACILEKNVLIGINATILDRAVIGENSIVGAHALVTYGSVIPPNSLALGMPAKVIKTLDEEQLKNKVRGTQIYKNLVVRCLSTLKKTTPISK